MIRDDFYGCLQRHRLTMRVQFLEVSVAIIALGAAIVLVVLKVL